MNSFVLYADCSVVYDGRAYSTLKRGNYLIVYKPDGSLLIHGAKLTTPLNYQPPGAECHRVNNEIIFTRKKETIVITIHGRELLLDLPDWDYNKIEISRTEQDLVNKIIADAEKLLGFKPSLVQEQFPTAAGPIDLMLLESVASPIRPLPTHHLIEVKRGHANIAACGQLERYYNATDCMQKVGHLASPSISSNAEKYLKDRGFNWIRVGFDP